MGPSSRSADVAKIIVSLLAAFLAGGIGSVFTTSSLPNWYAGLQKPFFTPPDWLFAPAWTILYVLMAVAAFLVWRQGLRTLGVRRALWAYLVQLILNVLWSVVFFGLKSPLFGMVVILFLWFAIIVTTVRFFWVSRTAAWLMVPYAIWVTFASVLNIGIYALNH